MTPLSSKLKALERILADMQSVLVAYSGGTDSTFLLKVASKVLGDKAIAVTASSETYTPRELQEARKNAETIGAKHLVVHTNELDDPRFSSNPPGRCYYCKKELFAKLFALAKEHGLNHVIDGSNCDDEKDYRPGMRAAAEFSVRSPLKDAGFTKEEIRALSKEMNLPTWDKPPLPCLSSRFPYGTKITREKISRVASAEEFLANLGIRQLRVRDHDNIARIEVPRADMPVFLDEKTSKLVVEKFKALGYTYITLDLQGYRMGSMNEPLKETR
ncbi:MAG TPA: ATP-dependent sacrificial sulfur transferase LarE [Syntrophales bacterium]|nr:ATP-dependent sacrificial sulfur transferase LarE [Syntrophales bacterium]